MSGVREYVDLSPETMARLIAFRAEWCPDASLDDALEIAILWTHAKEFGEMQ